MHETAGVVVEKKKTPQQKASSLVMPSGFHSLSRSLEKAISLGHWVEIGPEQEMMAGFSPERIQESVSLSL